MYRPKKKPICKVCPKKLKPCKSVNDSFGLEGEFEVPIEDDYEEEEEEEEEEKESFICLEEESCKDLATAGFVVQEITQDKRKTKMPFFCPTAFQSRYENMLPMDYTNDNQYEASLQKTIIDHMCALKVNSEPFYKRQTAIIGTIGPSCTNVYEIENLLDSGMNIARLNMAYGDRCCQLNAIHNFKKAVKNFNGRTGMKIPVGLMMDLKGPEIRTGRICRMYACDPKNPKIFLEKGSSVKITTEIEFQNKITPSIVYVDFPEFISYIRPGMKIHIDDGSIQLVAQIVNEKAILAKVEVEGYLRNYRQIHVPMVPMDFPPLTNSDLEDIQLALEEDFDFICVSKIYSAEVIKKLRGVMVSSLLRNKVLRETPLKILAKISNYQAMNNIKEIVDATDGIIIQRGDLGLDIPPEKVIVAQKNIIGVCNSANKPVILMTQLMKSMMKHPLVDRSHVFDIACGIDDGADSVCLTGETAIGLYPWETVEQTHHILREAEASYANKYHFKEILDKMKSPVEPIFAIGMGAVIAAEKIKASCIIVITNSGRSARIISWFRPRCIVLAITKFQRTARQLHLWRSICPLIYTGPYVKNNWFDNLDYKFQFGIAFGKEVGFIRAGDPMVLVSGYGKDSAFTNCLRIVYASTEPSVFLDHPKEFYDNIYLQRNCPKSKKTGT